MVSIKQVTVICRLCFPLALQGKATSWKVGGVLRHINSIKKKQERGYLEVTHEMLNCSTHGGNVLNRGENDKLNWVFKTARRAIWNPSSLWTKLSLNITFCASEGIMRCIITASYLHFQNVKIAAKLGRRCIFCFPWTIVYGSTCMQCGIAVTHAPSAVSRRYSTE